ncbi:MAG TPA: NUDIX domain-containing protein [Candidatus Saccharimonadales bacterium]|nr:NUDIX domain-containing protein [Candidatus Saccharimonadales bacterium]
MQTRIVAKVLVADTHNDILLLKRSETDVRRPLQWDIPGGHSNEHESPDQAAVREVLEETGIKLSVRSIQLVYATSETVTSNLNVVWLYYIAKVSRQPVVLSHEHAAYSWVTFAQAVDMIEYDRQSKFLKTVQTNNLLQAV